MKPIRTFFSAGLGILLLVLVLCTSRSSVLADLPQQTDEPIAQALLPILLFQDRFDGSTIGVTRTVDKEGDYGWGRVIGGDWANTFWCAQDGTPALTAGNDPYTRNMSTTVTYGPINLQVTTATLEFTAWISVASGDGLEWGYSTDGIAFTYSPVSTATMGTWQTITVGLDPLLGQNAAYLAFRFQSDDAEEDLGVFLDNVTVRAQEDVVPNFTVAAASCAGTAVQFTDASTATSGIQSRVWTFGDGSGSTVPNPTHTYAAAGEYTVWLTVTSNLGNVLATYRQVSIQSATAQIGITPDLGNVVCRNTPTIFSDQSIVFGTLSGRRWLFGDDGSTSDAISVTHIFNSLGSFDVRLWVTTTAGCASQATKTVSVVEPPTPPALQMSTSSTWTGLTVYFTDTGSSGSFVYRLWNFGDGTAISTTNASVSHVYTRAGPKTVTLSRINSSGCASSAQGTLGVSGKTFLPVVFRNFFQGYEKTDNFTNWGSGWPAGNKRTLNPDGSVAEEYSYGYKVDNTLGGLNNPTGKYPVTLGGLYHIWVRDDGDHVFLTGPESLAVVQNFTFAASLRRVTPPVRDGDEYGILISSQPINGLDQWSDLVYTFQVRVFTDPNTRRAVVKKWQLKGNHSRYVFPGSEQVFQKDGWLTGNQNWWNRFYIIRQGNTLHFCMQSEETWEKWNEACVYNVTDNSLPEKLYIGFYAAHVKDYAYNMEYQFDDVYIKSTPW